MVRDVHRVGQLGQAGGLSYECIRASIPHGLGRDHLCSGNRLPRGRSPAAGGNRSRSRRPAGRSGLVRGDHRECRTEFHARSGRCRPVPHAPVDRFGAQSTTSMAMAGRSCVLLTNGGPQSDSTNASLPPKAGWDVRGRIARVRARLRRLEHGDRHRRCEQRRQAGPVHHASGGRGSSSIAAG